MRYAKYRYVFPPRPKNAVPQSELDFWDGGTMIAQPKLNGSNTTIYTNGIKVIVMNRHNQRLTNFRITDEEVISSIYRGNGEWMAINGEYMNKSKNDKYNKVFNHKFVIFDILILEGNYLVGTTFEQRVDMLDNMYGQIECDDEFLYNISENIFRVKSYKIQFNYIFTKLVEIDMYEGLVMKRRNAKLEMGTSEMNNVKSQIKCRKVTKNYKY
jgi:hypothetical protein